MKKTTTFSLFICLLLVLTVPNRLATAQMAGNTTVGIFGRHAVAPGQRLILPVEVKSVADLYAVDLSLQYDPKLLKIVDAEPDTPGSQVALGTFLDPGLLLMNEVDESNGILHFVMSQTNPSEAKSGDGVLLVVTFEGIKEGVSYVKIAGLEMSTREGLAIAGLAADSQVTVKVGAPVQPDLGIPTQPSGTVVIVPPAMPTEVQTALAESTAALQPTTGVATQPTSNLQVIKNPAQAFEMPTKEPAPEAQPDQTGDDAITLIVLAAAGVFLIGVALLLLRRSKLDQTNATYKY